MENIIIAVYKQAQTTYQVLSDLKNRSGQSRVSVAGIIQNVGGSIVVKDGWSTTVGGTAWASGGLVGTLIGILGGPVGMLLGAGVGMLVGSAMDADSLLNQSGMIEKASYTLQDGAVGLVMIAEEGAPQELDAFLRHYGDVVIIRKDAEAVRQEIAQAQAATVELQKQARAQMREQKKEERQHKFEDIKAKAQEDFNDLKELVKS